MIIPLPKPFWKLLLLQAVTELTALKRSSRAELSLEVSSLLQQGAEIAEGQLSVDVSLAPVAPVRSGFRFTVGAILGSTHSGGTKYLEFRTIKWWFSLCPDFPWVGAPFPGVPQPAPNEVSVQRGRNQLLWKKMALKQWKEKSSKPCPKNFLFSFLFCKRKKKAL